MIKVVDRGLATLNLFLACLMFYRYVTTSELIYLAAMVFYAFCVGLSWKQE